MRYLELTLGILLGVAVYELVCKPAVLYWYRMFKK